MANNVQLPLCDKPEEVTKFEEIYDQSIKDQKNPSFTLDLDPPWIWGPHKVVRLYSTFFKGEEDDETLYWDVLKLVDCPDERDDLWRLLDMDCFLMT